MDSRGFTRALPSCSTVNTSLRGFTLALVGFIVVRMRSLVRDKWLSGSFALAWLPARLVFLGLIRVRVGPLGRA